jgi:hypothetical protein
VRFEVVDDAMSIDTVHSRVHDRRIGTEYS